MKNFRKNEIGITLIALVITVIVLLILAGVTIATITGDNGILTRAQEAKNQTENAGDIEKIRLAITEAQIGENGYQELDATNFQEALNNQFEGKNLQLTDNGDGSFIVNIDNMSKKYYVDSTGQIISNENMLEISTKEELKAFRDDVNKGNTYEGWYVYLTNDIILDINEEWEPIGIYQEESTSPDDENNIPFKGIFDGRYHTISGIYTNSDLKNRGLFGLIKEATIENVGIVNGNIQGTSRTGAIVGYAYQNSKIINCYNSSNIIATNNYVGGIAGFIKDETIIQNCYNTGNITSSGQEGIVGGIIGGTSNALIYNCYNSGNIISSAQGGIIGGIIGGIGKSTMKNCYNTGMIEGKTVGGISGSVSNNALIENCYNVGSLKSTGGNAYGINSSGNSFATFKNNYYLENTVNGSNDIYPEEECKVKNSQEMKELYSALGKAYEEDANNINNGYPILTWQ